MLEDLGQQEHRVVVPFLGAARELPGPGEQPGALRHGEGAEQCQLERSRRVPGKLLERCEEGDPLMVDHRIEPPDLRHDRAVPHVHFPRIASIATASGGIRGRDAQGSAADLAP